jgi:hypothetical protein
VKVLGHLVPREMKVEHSQVLKTMSDEELEAAIEYVRGLIAARAGEGAKVIEGAAEPAALPALLCQTALLGDPTSSWLRPTRQSARESASRGSARCRRSRASDLVGRDGGFSVLSGMSGTRGKSRRFPAMS